MRRGCPPVPTPTADEIRDAAAQSAEDGVSTHTSDGQSTTAMDIEKQLKAADRIGTAAALSGTNSNGGKPSGWGKVRMGRVVPPGAGPE